MFCLSCSIGERIQIQSLPVANATGQPQTIQVKPPVGGATTATPLNAQQQQTLQLQGLNIDPSKLTVLQVSLGIIAYLFI